MLSGMPALANVVEALEAIAPLRLAAPWDAVGLLVATRRPAIGRILTCLSITPAIVREAVAERIDLVVAHHPLPFKPVARLVDASLPGSLLLDLAGAGIGVWSSHTAWDSAAGGINDQLAALLGLADVRPLVADAVDPTVGTGRGGLPEDAPALTTVADVATRLCRALGVCGAHVVGDPGRPAGRVGIVCGSGGECLPLVSAAGCRTLVTGELRLHDALAADHADVAVVAVGHQASEQFGMRSLGRRLEAAVPGIECRESRSDRDPLPWLPLRG